MFDGTMLTIWAAGDSRGTNQRTHPILVAQAYNVRQVGARCQVEYAPRSGNGRRREHGATMY
jgi:hypothetical protein